MGRAQATAVYKAPQLRRRLANVVARGLAGPGLRCPSCHAGNHRQNNANNIHCWNCFTNFCAHCKKKLAKGKVGKHYGAGGCPQHHTAPLQGAVEHAVANADAALQELRNAPM